MMNAALRHPDDVSYRGTDQQLQAEADSALRSVVSECQLTHALTTDVPEGTPVIFRILSMT